MAMVVKAILQKRIDYPHIVNTLDKRDRKGMIEYK